MENLPEEIAMEILSRLPAESIIRCMCAVKSWYALSKDPTFVAKHLGNQCRPSNNNFVFMKQTNLDNRSLRDNMYILSNDSIDDPEIVRLPSSIKRRCGSGLRLIGHCGGLIALGDGKEGIFVCNPATREFRTLPSSSLGPLHYEGRYFRPLLGFGYDYKSNDYKIVRVVDLLHCETDCLTQRAEVFCLRTDSCWREVNVAIDSSLDMLVDFDLREPYFNGVCYWLTIAGETCQRMLTSFHLADEVFTNTPLPRRKYYKSSRTIFSIGVYNNSVALYIHPAQAACVDIWVMKEFGVKEPWTQQLTIHDPLSASTDFYHLGFWNGNYNEFLFVHDGQLAIYNRVTLESRRLPLQGVEDHWTSISYRKTTVSVKSRVAVQPAMKKAIFENLFSCRKPNFQIPKFRIIFGTER